MAPELSVVIPAYREEENLRLLLPRLQAVLTREGIPAETLVIDTVSPLDKTVLVCAENGARYVPRNGGNEYGNAVRTGIREASGTHTLFMDADGSHSPEFLPSLWRHRADCDVVIASRYVEGGDTENPWVLILMSRIVNLAYSMLLGIRCKDVSNSFKLYRSEQLRSLELRCDNFDIVEEILVRLNRRYSLRIREVPSTFKKRLFGRTKRNLFLFILTYAFTLLRLRFRR